MNTKYKTAISRRQVGHEADESGLPAYIAEGSVEAKKWHQRHPDQKRVSSTCRTLFIVVCLSWFVVTPCVIVTFTYTSTHKYLRLFSNPIVL